MGQLGTLVTPGLLQSAPPSSAIDVCAIWACRWAAQYYESFTITQMGDLSKIGLSNDHSQIKHILVDCILSQIQSDLNFRFELYVHSMQIHNFFVYLSADTFR